MNGMLKPTGANSINGGISTAEARSQMADVVNRVEYGKERILLTRRGKEILAFVPIEDLRWLEDIEDRVDIELARQALEEAEREGWIPWEDVKRELGMS